MQGRSRQGQELLLGYATKARLGGGGRRYKGDTSKATIHGKYFGLRDSGGMNGFQPGGGPYTGLTAGGGGGGGCDSCCC